MRRSFLFFPHGFALLKTIVPKGRDYSLQKAGRRVGMRPGRIRAGALRTRWHICESASSASATTRASVSASSSAHEGEGEGYIYILHMYICIYIYIHNFTSVYIQCIYSICINN